MLFEIFEDLKIEQIKVDYENNVYNFQFDSKKKLNLNDLNNQLNI